MGLWEGDYGWQGTVIQSPDPPPRCEDHWVRRDCVDRPRIDALRLCVGLRPAEMAIYRFELAHCGSSWDH